MFDRKPVRWLRNLSAVICLCFLSQGFAQLPNEPVWSVAGVVNQVVADEDATYVCGNFYRTGIYTGFSGLLDPTDGSLSTSFPYIDGPVYAAVSDGDGGWYIGGDFQHVAGEPRGGLAHLLGDLSLDPDFTADVTGGVRTLEFAGTSLFVGGTFSAINGIERSYLASVDAADGSLVDWAPSINGRINAMVRNGTTLYLGGLFGDSGGLIAVNTQSGQVDGSFDAQVAGEVSATVIDGSWLYFGGYFSTVGGEPRVNLASVNLATGAIGPWNPGGTSFTVNTLLVNDTTLYVGGAFLTVGTEDRRYLAAVSLLDGHVLSWDNSLNEQGPVLSLAMHGDRLIAAGGRENFATLTDNYVLALDTQDQATAWKNDINGPVFSLALSSDQLLMGGEFTAASLIDTPYLAVFDHEAFRPLPWRSDDISVCNDVIVDGDTIYVAGFNKLQALNKSTGSLIWEKPSSGRIRTLALRDQMLYLGGDFTMFDNQPRTRLAAIDIGTQQLQDWIVAADDRVNDLLVIDDQVFIAGNFSMLGSKVRSFVGSVDLSGGLSDWAPVFDNQVILLAQGHGALYVNGYFQTVDAVGQTGLAAFELGSLQLRDWPNKSYSYGRLAIDSASVYTGGFEYPTAEAADIGTIDPFTSTSSTWDPDIKREWFPWEDMILYEPTGLTVTDRQLIVSHKIRLDRSGRWDNYQLLDYYDVLMTFDILPPTTAISPQAGMYDNSRQIELDCNPVSATQCNGIFYTVDGSEPDTSSTLYTEPIPLTQDTVIKFFAKNEWGHGEQVQTVQYQVDALAPVTTSDPAGGTFSQALTVELSCVDDKSGCAEIRYTLDGGDPSATGLVYEAPLTIDANTTLTYLGIDQVGNAESVHSETFAIEQTPSSSTRKKGGGSSDIGLLLFLWLVWVVTKHRRKPSKIAPS